MCYSYDVPLPTAPATIVDLPMALIAPENNDRQHFAGIDELAESIARHGLVQAITVRPRTDGTDGYWLVAGERRWRAHRLLGAETIRAIVEDADDERASWVMLVENVHRQDLNPMDEAEAYGSRMERFGMTADEVAAASGVSAHRIKTYLPLLKLVPELAAMVRSGALGMGAAYELVGQNGVTLDGNRQLLAHRALVTEGLTVAQLRHVVAKLVDEQSQEVMFDADSFLQVETWAREAKVRKLGKAGLTDLAARLADALAEADPGHPLVAATREALAA